MPWRSLAALALGAAVAVVVAAGVLALGRDSSPEPPEVIRLEPGPATIGEGAADDAEAEVVVPPPVHLEPTSTTAPVSTPPASTPTPAPVAPTPVPSAPVAPAPDDDRDDHDDVDDADDPDGFDDDEDDD